MTPIFHDRHFTINIAPDAAATVDVQVYYREDCRQVAVVTPPADANYRLADIIDSVANRLRELDYDFDFLIEHNPERPLPGAGAVPETFDLVCFRWNPETGRYHVEPTSPSWPWQNLCRDEAEAIIGEPYEDGQPVG